MTHNFYEVNRTTVNFSPLQLLQSQADVKHCLRQANYTLFPYIVPKSPYQPPSKSALQHIDIVERYRRKIQPYQELRQLSLDEQQALLNSYQTYKHPSFARANPTDVTNPFYQWVVKYNLSAWDIELVIRDKASLISENINSEAMQAFLQTGYPTYHEDKAPLWCHQRMGQSQTVLNDGRVLLIGGEYEDSYDPDFCIYNDVIVKHPNGDSTIYRYPKLVFPPTDFHTATLINNKNGDEDYILIIGSLGYVYDRQYNHTPVYRLDLATMQIQTVATRNTMGWIHHHKAVQQGNKILVTGGQVILSENAPLIDNIDTWALNLNTLRWKNLTNRDRKWHRFYVKRQDGNTLSYYDYQQLIASMDALRQAQHQNESADRIARIMQNIKQETQYITSHTHQSPNFTLYQQLLIPPVAHEPKDAVDNRGDYYNNDANTSQLILIDGVKIAYKDDDHAILVTIMNDDYHKLSPDTVELLQQNLRHKLSKLENTVCEVIDFADIAMV